MLKVRAPLRRLASTGSFMLAAMVFSMPAVAEPLASSYLEAQEFGRRDEADPKTLEYHRNLLLPQFSQRYRALLRECQASLPQPDPSPFSFVAAIGEDGRVLKLWSDRSPPVYSCVRGRLLFERFAPPPRAPFYLYIHMRFAQ
jgi:hypothetical protein